MSGMSAAELLTISVFLLDYWMQACYLFTRFTWQDPFFFKTLNIHNNKTVILHTTLYYIKLKRYMFRQYESNIIRGRVSELCTLNVQLQLYDFLSCLLLKREGCLWLSRTTETCSFQIIIIKCFVQTNCVIVTCCIRTTRVTLTLNMFFLKSHLQLKAIRMQQYW